MTEEIGLALTAPVILSGLSAGAVAILATLSIEKLGGHLGGIIGTLPTTIVPASIGIWSTGGIEGGSIALYSVPAGMCLNAIFLWLWRAFPPLLNPFFIRKSPHLYVTVMSVLTLGLWALGAILWVIFQGDSAPFYVGLCSTLALCALGVWATRTPKTSVKGRHQVGIWSLLSRGIFAALAIGVSILIASSGAPMLAGISSVFPAIFWTSMVSLWLSQGPSLPTNAVGPMMLGSTSVALYALCAPTFFQSLGPGWGAVVAWTLAVSCGSLPAYLWIKRRAL